MQPASGSAWEQVVSINAFATDAESYSWKIVHMAADKSTVLNETAGGCFSLRDPERGDSSSGGPSLPDGGLGPPEPVDPGG